MEQLIIAVALILLASSDTLVSRGLERLMIGWRRPRHETKREPES